MSRNQSMAAENSHRTRSGVL